MNIDVQDLISLSSLDRLKLMHSMEAEFSCEHTGTNGARKHSLNRENLSKSRGPFFRCEERFLNKTEI